VAATTVVGEILAARHWAASCVRVDAHPLTVAAARSLGLPSLSSERRYTNATARMPAGMAKKRRRCLAFVTAEVELMAVE
jgi:hypothetical protein